MADWITGTATPDGTVMDSDKDVQTFEIGGEEVTLDQIQERKKGYMRQDDYTRKTQELAELRKGSQSSPKSEDEIERDTLTDELRKRGFAVKDDLKQVQTQTKMEASFGDLLSSTPELKKHEAAIRALQSSEWGAYEDVIQKYGFLSADKLKKAKSANRVTPGRKIDGDTTVSIADLWVEEYEAYKNKMGLWGSVLEMTTRRI